MLTYSKLKVPHIQEMTCLKTNKTELTMQSQKKSTQLSIKRRLHREADILNQKGVFAPHFCLLFFFFNLVAHLLKRCANDGQ